MSVALLPDVLTGALLEVAVAWGADLTAADTTWTWSDITTDVRLLPGIEPTNGRGDEASTTQPATCTFTLDNSSGRYSLGPQSSNYPFVRQGVPVRLRVRASAAAAWVVVFQGNAAEWQPSWNLRGSVAEVSLVAAGTLRRLAQGVSPVISAWRRTLLTTSTIVAYWPCEDGKAATSFAAPMGRPPMTWSGSPKLAESDSFNCSLTLPQPNGAVYYGDVPSHTPAANSEFSARVLIAWPDSSADGSIPLRVFTTGTTANRVDLVYGTGGSLRAIVYDYFNNVVYTSTTYGFDLDGVAQLLRVTLRITAGVLVVEFGAQDVSGRVAVATESTGVAITAATLGIPRKLIVNPTRGLTDAVMGHFAIQAGSGMFADELLVLSGFVGEFALDRIYRLCSENGIWFDWTIADPDASISAADYLGPQRPDDVVSLLRAAEKTDQGLLFDGVSQGLYYVPRRARESASPAIVIDAAAGQLSPSFDVLADDQRTRNVATVSRDGGGAESTFRDDASDRGTAAVGVYDTSASISAQLDEATYLYAGWLVSLGTVPGYRYPSVSVDLRKNPSLVAAWLNVTPGTRIDIVNLSSVLPGHPTGTVSLMVEGVTNRFDDTGWMGTARCSPFLPWQVASYAAALPANDPEWVTRGDTSGSAATAARAQGASTLQVATSAGPLWTTASSDYPLVLEVGGRQVRATACSGSTSPQTFTVDPLPAAVSAGAAVRLWQPPTPGL